jgi:hypothetical protein
MIPVRKAQAGGSSSGYQWPHDGAVVLVDPDLVAELLAIPDGGFTVAEEERVVEEPAPEPDAPVDEAPKPVRRPRRTTKAADPVTVEE